MVSKTSARGPLLAPRELWPDEAQRYWDVFPRGSVLIDDYASSLDSSSWSEAADKGVLVTDLLRSEEEDLTELEKYALNPDLEGDGHSAAAPVEIGKLAFITPYSMRRCAAVVSGRRDFFSSSSITWSTPTSHGSSA